jgi:hypothetical protein
MLHCYVHDLYDGQRMRPEKLEAWRALRERYGNRDESRVDRAPSWPRPPEPSRSPAHMGEEQQRERQRRCTPSDRRRSPRTRRR